MMTQNDSIDARSHGHGCSESGHLNPLFEASVCASGNYAIFRSLPLCNELGGRESMLLFSCLEERTVPAGTVLYSEGTPSQQTMHLILRGEVSLQSPWHNIYSRLGAGDIFGLFTFLDEGRLHSATVRAETELTLLLLDRPRFDLLTLEEPLLGNQMLRLMFRLLSRMALRQENEYAALHKYTLGGRS